ncbi:MAG: hypothetical protein WA152_02980 [Microgenomates group bacterium]|jgi:hypothetical protein
MAQIVREGVSDSSREAYLRELYQEAQGGDKNAIEELSHIALGRNDLPLAKDLVKSLENQNKNEG